VALALPTWHIGVRVGEETTQTASKVDGVAALNHIYNHIFGLGSPASYSAAAVHSESPAVVEGMPTTGIFERPAASLVFTVRGGGDIFGKSRVGAEKGFLEDTAKFYAESQPLDWALMHAYARRPFSPSSLEVLPAAAEVSGVSGIAVQWHPSLGYVSSGTAQGVFLDADFLGVTACTEAGKRALATVGFSVSSSGHGSCPTFEGMGKLGPVQMNAGKGAVAHALSEVALIVLLAEHTVQTETHALVSARVERELGVLLHRAVFSGAAAIAATYGVASEEYLAVVTGYSLAIASADKALREVFPAGRVAVVVFSSEPSVDGAAEDLAILSSGPSYARFLASNSSSSTVSYSLEDVAAYHVALWTAVILGGTLLFTIYAMLGMDDKKDPALYANVMDNSAHTHRS
jgi:hypothetical protein